VKKKGGAYWDKNSGKYRRKARDMSMLGELGAVWGGGQGEKPTTRGPRQEGGNYWGVTRKYKKDFKSAGPPSYNLWRGVGEDLKGKTTPRCPWRQLGKETYSTLSSGVNYKNVGRIGNLMWQEGRSRKANAPRYRSW